MLNVPKLANKAMSKVDWKVLAEKYGNSAKEFKASGELEKYILKAKNLEPSCDNFQKISKIDLSKIAETEIKTAKKPPVWKRILGKIFG